MLRALYVFQHFPEKLMLVAKILFPVALNPFPDDLILFLEARNLFQEALNPLRDAIILFRKALNPFKVAPNLK